MKCLTTSTVVTVSVASSAGLTKGTSAPYFLATSAISGQSVLTTTESIYFDLSAASIVQTMRGLPQKSLMFLPGRRLLPPRAGINATILRSFWFMIISLSADCTDSRRLRGKERGLLEGGRIREEDKKRLAHLLTLIETERNQ